MHVREHGKALVFSRLTRPVLDTIRTAPGRVKYKDGDAWVETSGVNLDHFLARLPSLAEADLPSVRTHLGIVEGLAEGAAKRSQTLPPEASAFPFRREPYSVQRQAFALGRGKEFFGYFMEMGLGKTFTTICDAFDLHMKGEINTVIVLAPNGVHEQWVEEQLPEHAPEGVPYEAFTYFSGMNTKTEKEMWRRENDRESFQWFTMALETISASKKAQDTFVRWLNRKNVMVVIDESQAIKNPGASRTKFLLRHRPSMKFRRILTGTEVTQGIEDLYSQMAFLHPGILGHNSFTSFRAEYCNLRQIPNAPAGAYMITGYRNVDKLKQRLAGCTFHALKKDWLDLPEKIYVKRFVEMTGEQKKLYLTMKQDLLAEINGQVITAPLALTTFTKLQQITSGFLGDEEGVIHEIPNNRIKTVLDILSERKQAIIWCRFRYDVEKVAEALEKEGYRVGKYYGDTSDEDRAEFRKPGAVDVLVCTRAARAGLNLTHFNTAVYFSHSPSGEDRWQSEDRIHRIGQRDDCLYIDLVCPGTIDEHVLKILRKKREVADLVRDGARKEDTLAVEVVRGVLGL